MLGKRPRAAFLRERCELREVGGLEEGPHVLVLLFERLPPALLPVDDGEDADDLVAGFLEFLAREERGGAGGDHVVDRDDFRAARKLVLDFAAGPVLLRLLAGIGAFNTLPPGWWARLMKAAGVKSASMGRAPVAVGFPGGLFIFSGE